MKKILLILLTILLLTSTAHALQKNTASQYWFVFCFDETDGTPKTGDAAQIDAGVYVDAAAVDALADAAPVELARGYYRFEITAAESNGDYILIEPYSSTGNVQCKGEPSATWTTAPGHNAVTIANGAVDANITYVQEDAVTDNADGRLEVNVEEVGDSAISETVAGHLDVNVTYWEDDAVPGTADGIPDVDTIQWDDSAITDADATPDVDVDTIEGGDATDALDTAADTVTVTAMAADVIGVGDIATGAIDADAMNVTGSEFSAIPWNAAWDAEVESEVADEMVDLNLDHLMKTAVANNADMTTEVTDGTVVSNIISSTSDTSTYVVADDSLQGISEGAAGGGATAQEVWEYGTRVLTGNTNLNDPTAASIADAVWDEVIVAAHDISNSAGALLDSPADWATATGFSTHSAADAVNEWETQSQADPTGFHVNVKEVNGTAQTANDNSADINAILTDTAAYDTDGELATALWNAATATYGGAGTYGQAVEDALADTNEIQGNQDWNVWDDAARTLTALDEDTTTLDLDGTTIGTASDVTNLGGTAAATQINNQVADVLKTDTITEHGVASPSATPTMEDMLIWLYMAWRNETQTTSSETRVTNNAGTVVTESNISDDGTTFTKEEFGAVD